MAVLVGSSSTGKTRACWEAVQPLAPARWRLWHPVDPTYSEAALTALAHVPPRTVVWLDETQLYLGAGQGIGERIAAALRSLLTDPVRGPVLVLGTLWPVYARGYSALPQPGTEDRHPQARKLLAGCRISLPDSFDAAATAATRTLAAAGDRQLAQALKRAHDGRLTQYLAGAPELLHRYEISSPAARALLDAAMDARRLGVGPHLPLPFLKQAVESYLDNNDHDALSDDWLDQALEELSRPVHGNLAPLRRVRHRITPTTPGSSPATPPQPAYRLVDYLDQHGRHQRRLLCPPTSFWHAAHTHLTHPDELVAVADAAGRRHRLQWAHHLRYRAADYGNTSSSYVMWDEWVGNGFYVGQDFIWLNPWDTEGVDAVISQAGSSDRPSELYRGALRRERAGDRQGAETFAQQAADRSNTRALHRLAVMREEAGDRKGAETLARQAADRGNPLVLYRLAVMREEAGDRKGAETLARQAADQGGLREFDLLKRLWPHGLDPDGTPTHDWR
ncbi:hypothetical protein [Streptomyces longisporus]